MSGPTLSPASSSPTLNPPSFCRDSRTPVSTAAIHGTCIQVGAIHGRIGARNGRIGAMNGGKVTINGTAETEAMPACLGALPAQGEPTTG
eukprot:378965-Rhodomonas_salina.1